MTDASCAEIACSPQRVAARVCMTSASRPSVSRRPSMGSRSTAQMRVRDRLWAIGDVTGLWQLTHVGEYQGDVAASNILGEPREANYEAVPRAVYTDPQAAAVGATEAAFSATAPLKGVPKLATWTRAYAESNGFLTLLSDGERLDGRLCAGPGGWRVAAAGDSGDPRPCAAWGAARHDSSRFRLSREFSAMRSMNCMARCASRSGGGERRWLARTLPALTGFDVKFRAERKLGGSPEGLPHTLSAKFSGLPASPGLAVPA